MNELLNMADELLKAAEACREHVRIHSDLSDITTTTISPTERLLLIQAADTMEKAKLELEQAKLDAKSFEGLYTGLW